MLAGTTPLTGVSLAGEPQDNITPLKIRPDVRVERSSRPLVGAPTVLRVEAEVTRVSPLLSESPFLIAQDLLGLDGLHRAARGGRLQLARRAVSGSALTLAVDNLTDTLLPRAVPVRAGARGRSR